MGPLEALRVIDVRADAGLASAPERWTSALPGAGALDLWVDRFRNAGRLTVNFHPDRRDRAGRSVAAGLASDGEYRSQWVTGTSAGSRSAVTGGERHRFERELFGGAYDVLHPAAPRPVYGALDLLHDEHGGSPRFGSSYLVLAAHVRERATLCVGDSHVAPRDVGTFGHPWLVLAGLAEQAQHRALLRRGLGGEELLTALMGTYRLGRATRDLDGYVELQVHGSVSLADDVEAVVLDPSFRGTEIERDVVAASARFGVGVAWHCGSELAVAEVPDDFRGPTMPDLARRVADSGLVHARAIGARAAAIGFTEPCPDGDPPESELQQLKYLWHTVVAHGHDADPADRDAEIRTDPGHSTS